MIPLDQIKPNSYYWAIGYGHKDLFIVYVYEDCDGKLSVSFTGSDTDIWLDDVQHKYVREFISYIPTPNGSEVVPC